MKAAITATVSAIIGGLAYVTIALQSANSRLEEQLQSAMSYQQQLQEQILLKVLLRTTLHSIFSHHLILEHQKFLLHWD